MATSRFLQSEPKGLERAHCDTCQGTFTIVKGLCTGCIRREENRKQGVLYVGVGATVAFLGGTGLSMFGLSLVGIACLFTGFIGLGILARGARAVIFGRNAE